MDLSGTWAFALDPEKVGIKEEFFEKDLPDSITLPGTTSQAQKGTPSDKRETGFLTDPYLTEGYAWYSTNIALTREEFRKTVKLHLERTRITKVWIDNRLVGEENSLTTPHDYDLTPFIKSREFKLTIMVSNVDYPTRGGHLTSPDTQTNWLGILGEISLNLYDDVYIEHIKTYPDVDTKSVRVEIHTVNTSNTQRNVSVCAQAALLDISGDTGVHVPAEYFQNIFFPVGKGKEEFTYSLGEDAVLWSEYSPVIYFLQLTIPGTDEMASTTFGLRKFSTTETEFLINDTPTFLRGKHDGLVFPLTGAFPTTLDEWIEVMKISKSYGINHYRYHTCCPPEAAFLAADLLGIYMEPQLPFWGTLTSPDDEEHNAEEQDYLIEEGFRMMKAYGNHASYCMMSLGNELWGSKERMAEIITNYRNEDDRHLYTQGSNNFQHTPVLLPEDDFYVGVRFSKNRLIRGSYGMCDAPLGHIQWGVPSTDHNYDEDILPTNAENSNADGAEEIEIQYGTGVKKVKAADGDGPLIPHIPVVTHEIGQFAVYPNFREIDKYTGVLKARNFEVFREHLESKGMLDQADDFFEASGKLSVRCYKEELEAAARSKLVAGYQILDIQDFPGQGTALVGILDAFMDSKGHVTPEEWAGYCSDHILLAQFSKYVYTSGEEFSADMAIRYYNPYKLEGQTFHWELIKTRTKEICASGDLPIPDGAFGLVDLGTAKFNMPEIDRATTYKLEISVANTSIFNSYDIYSYPELTMPDLSVSVGSGNNKVSITHDFDEATKLLAVGKRVLYLPNEVKESLEGFYCTDFWCYPMFRDICEWMKKPVAVGTMGLLIQNKHRALASFPSEKYSTPQWYQIVTASRCAILDDTTAPEFRPIVQMIDNFERNHKLGILFEGRVGKGKLMVCTSKLSEVSEYPEVKQFTKSILDYMTSDSFIPRADLDMDLLKKTFVGK